MIDGEIMILGIGIGATATFAGVYFGGAIMPKIVERVNHRIENPEPKKEKKPLINLKKSKPKQESVINLSPIEATPEIQLAEENDFDNLINEHENGVQFASLEKHRMHELADDVLAVGVADSSSRTPHSHPRCFICGKLAKKETWKDGKNYCGKHLLEVEESE